MREEISALAGPRQWGDTRESWLSRVPRAVKGALRTDGETVPYRMVKALWYGEIKDPEHAAARDIRKAAQIVQAKQQALELASKYRAVIGGIGNAANPNLFGDEIARLERVARLLCGEPGA